MQRPGLAICSKLSRPFSWLAKIVVCAPGSLSPAFCAVRFINAVRDICGHQHRIFTGRSCSNPARFDSSHCVRCQAAGCMKQNRGRRFQVDCAEDPSGLLQSFSGVASTLPLAVTSRKQRNGDLARLIGPSLAEMRASPAKHLSPSLEKPTIVLSAIIRFISSSIALQDYFGASLYIKLGRYQQRLTLRILLPGQPVVLAKICHAHCQRPASARLLSIT